MSDKESIIVEEPTIPYGKGYTYADYLAFDFDHMVELIKGRIFRMTPAPRSSHQEICGAIFSHIWQYLKSTSCKVYIAPFDVILPIANQQKNTASTVVQPDICIICDIDKIDEAGCTGPPDLIVEILSPSTSKKDLNDKYDIYEEAGVKEYWIVMPLEQLVEVFYLENGNYTRVKTYVATDTMSPIIFPDLCINLEDVFPDI